MEGANLNMKSSIELNKSIEKELKRLERRLPKRIDPAFISHKSKVPYKMADAFSSLLWRSHELGSTALRSINDNNIASGILLTRGLIETVSVAWYLYKKVENVVETKKIDKFDDTVMKILLGSRNGNTTIKSINILTMIDKVDQEINIFRSNYDLLSEFAHPNWDGTHGLYAKMDHNQIYTDYGQNINKDKLDVSIMGLHSIHGALLIIYQSYLGILKIRYKFRDICDNDTQ